MKLFTNKDVGHLFLKVSAVLILSVLCSLILSHMVIQDFKAQMLIHDYRIAGYLLEHGEKTSYVSEAFAASKAEQELNSGRKLLQAQGYKEDISTQLLPDADMLLSKYRLAFVLYSITFGAFILIAFFLYFDHQQSIIEKANSSINAFMSGDDAVRIDCNEEGSLFKLFASVNAMATSLSSHIEKEKHNKEFLKNTISDISHQLKTPLSALKMYNEIIEDEITNKETVKKFTSKTENALERMEILIKNLLKLAKLDSGSIMLNKKEENMKNLIQDSVFNLETRAKNERKSIIFNGLDNDVLYCDREWIIEAISNIVKNALDHMDEGGQVNIEWKETAAVTKIIIKDNGKGIHPEDIYHIFKRFYRSRFSQDTQGIGLGLPLAKSIVEAHDGNIAVKSTLGQGSIFILDFLKLTNL